MSVVIRLGGWQPWPVPPYFRGHMVTKVVAAVHTSPTDVKQLFDEPKLHPPKRPFTS